jgi:hypothetical protein
MVIGTGSRQSISNADESLRHRQQHDDAALRCKTTAIEGGCRLLARNGWRRELEEMCGGAMA